ncbi:MAG: SDR family oxidoreductase [Opitutales bacterium]|jgi:meso-butanediol dehydrogenase/(S,S)-butanediol dehydrogenase/diacetyl reductase|nr:SDR family oxidoreductase [Opitutales bacterium]
MPRTILITGGARGIGKGIAKAFLQAGDQVMIGDLGTQAAWNYDLASKSTLQEAISELEVFGTVNYVQLDVTDSNSCTNAIAQTVKAFGNLDVLVNNAGVVGSGNVDVFKEQEWDRIFDVNVKGIFLMTRAALSELRKSDNAAIVNTASIAGKKGSPGMSAYCASKFAAIGLTQSFAQEFASDGIRVNALCPGIVGTAMWLDHLMANEGEDAFQERMKDLIPLGRPQTEDDMGQAAVYLASAPNVTGIAHTVAGGLEMD